MQPMDQGALGRFSDIAYRCLKVSREDRPTMAEVVMELETALEIQDYSENKLISYYREIAKSAQPPLNYISNGELVKLLSKGALLNSGKTWFSINTKGEHYEMISFAECLDPGRNFETSTFPSGYHSRFVVDAYHYKNSCAETDPSCEYIFHKEKDTGWMNFNLITNVVNRAFNVVPPEKVSHHSEAWILKTHVKTHFLSPGIIYTVKIVFKFKQREVGEIYLRYKLKGETEYTFAHYMFERKDGWYLVDLYHLISDQGTVDLEILFDGYNKRFEDIYVEGIEFCPSEKVEDEKQSISDLGAIWEKNMPSDYEDMMKWSKDRVQWTTKKEAYSVMRKGFLIDNGEKWFSLDKNGKRCHIISARASGLNSKDGHLFFVPESRFGEAFECDERLVFWNNKITFKLLSVETKYSIYLVYRLPEDQYTFKGPFIIRSSKSEVFIYLVHPLPLVIKSKTNKKTHNPVNRPRHEGYPQQRDDGWMEVQVSEFYSGYEAFDSKFQLCCRFCNQSLSGLIVEGLELRPK